MAGGGTSSSTIEFPNMTAQYWGALVAGEDPGSASNPDVGDSPAQGFTFSNLDTSHVLADELSAALDAGSPFADVAAIDPTEYVELVATERDRLLALIAGLSLDDPGAFITALNADAKTAVETSLISSTDIATAVSAFEDRRQLEVSRAMSLVMAGYWEAGAVVGTQMGCALGGVVNQSQREVASFDANMLSQRVTQNAALIMQDSELMFKTALAFWELTTRGAHVATETGRFSITALQDQQAIDLKYLNEDLHWNLELYKYGFQAIASMGGAMAIPRAQTTGERILGAVTNSLSAGLSAGTALGPEAGIAVGATTGLMQLAAAFI